MQLMQRHFILLLIACVLSACQQVDNESLRELADELQVTLKQAKAGVQSLTEKGQSLTTEELEKLFIWEYRVEEVKVQTSSAELQTLLAELGRERWECFAVTVHGEQLRLYLKRHPRSYLRYLPRAFP